jgi:hypothetical protein
MSSRGRGGRGGRGYTPPSGAQLYLKRSAQEAGLDGSSFQSLQDITMPGALFAPLKWHSNGTLWKEDEEEDEMTMTPTTKRSSSTVYLIQKGRDLRARMQAQCQVRPRQEQDVKRYHSKQLNVTTNMNMSPSVAAKRLGPGYVPVELLQTTPKKTTLSPIKTAASKKKPNLQDLEEKERKRPTDGEEQEGEDPSALDQSYEQSDEEEEAADYTMNYYESEGDESDGGGGDEGEPTF